MDGSKKKKEEQGRKGGKERREGRMMMMIEMNQAYRNLVKPSITSLSVNSPKRKRGESAPERKIERDNLRRRQSCLQEWCLQYSNTYPIAWHCTSKRRRTEWCRLRSLRWLARTSLGSLQRWCRSRLWTTRRVELSWVGRKRATRWDAMSKEERKKATK